jgi:hypothetical protein
VRRRIEVFQRCAGFVLSSFFASGSLEVKLEKVKGKTRKKPGEAKCTHR